MARLFAPRTSGERVRVQPVPDFQLALVSLAAAAGLAFAAMGLTDIGLMWFPTRFGTPEWEVGTIGSTLESLTIMTLGFGLLTIAFLARGSKAGLTVLGIVFSLFTLLIIAALALFALDAPVALRGSPAEMQSTLKVVTIKNVVLGLVYTVLYGYLAYTSLRQARRARR